MHPRLADRMQLVQDGRFPIHSSTKVLFRFIITSYAPFIDDGTPSDGARTVF
jgi:hypothetical protein